MSVVHKELCQLWASENEKKRGGRMNFFACLGWVLFAFSLGFFIGLGVAGSAYQKKRNADIDRKVAEK